MISVSFNDPKFFANLNNIVNYANGFIDGVQNGKKEMLQNISKPLSEMIKKYIDSQARTDEMILHHVYEWYNTGSPQARLFNIKATVTNNGISFSSTFRQSSSVKKGSNVPFYDKARIMENGISVTIKPTKNVLAFNDNGEDVFTRKPVIVDNPGGEAATGSYEKTFDSFFNDYFTQSFLSASGLKWYLENPIIFKKNLSSAKQGGKQVGISTGYRWIVNTGIGAE